MKIFLTGSPGVGKTTIIKRIADQFPAEVFGFYSEEYRENRVRVGFNIIGESSEKVFSKMF